MTNKRHAETGRFIRYVPPARSREEATKVTLLQPKQRPSSASLKDIRKAVREVHGAKAK